MKLSLVDVVKIVLACAVASACIAPLHHLVQSENVGIATAIFVDAMVIPLVGALFLLLMGRRGFWRDILIEGLIAQAVIVPLGYFGWWVGRVTVFRVRRQGIGGLRLEDSVPILVGLVLASLLWFLIKRIFRRFEMRRIVGDTNDYANR